MRARYASERRWNSCVASGFSGFLTQHHSVRLSLNCNQMCTEQFC